LLESSDLLRDLAARLAAQQGDLLWRCEGLEHGQIRVVSRCVSQVRSIGLRREAISCERISQQRALYSGPLFGLQQIGVRGCCAVDLSLARKRGDLTCQRHQL